MEKVLVHQQKKLTLTLELFMLGIKIIKKWDIMVLIIKQEDQERTYAKKNKLREENQELKMELEILKKLNALVQERIKRETPKK